MNPTPAQSDETRLARQFHDTYERLAPEYGYATRSDTKDFDPNSPNGKLMIAVCNEVIAAERQRIFDAVEGAIGHDEKGLPIDDIYRTPKELDTYFSDRKARDLFRAELRAAIKRLREGI